MEDSDGVPVRVFKGKPEEHFFPLLVLKIKSRVVSIATEPYPQPFCYLETGSH